MPYSTSSPTRTKSWRLLALVLPAAFLLSFPVQAFCPTEATRAVSSSTTLSATTPTSTALNYRDEATEPSYVPPLSSLPSTRSSYTKPNKKKQWANTEALNDVKSMREERRRQQSYASLSSSSSSSNRALQQQQQQQQASLLKAIQDEKQTLRRHYNEMSSVAAEHDKRVRAPVLKLQDHGHLHFQLARRNRMTAVPAPQKKRFRGPPRESRRGGGVVRSLLPQVKEPLPTNTNTTRAASQSSTTTGSSSSTTVEAPPSTTTLVAPLGTEFHDTTTTTPSGLHSSRWHRYKKWLQWKPKTSLPEEDQ